MTEMSLLPQEKRVFRPSGLLAANVTILATADQQLNSPLGYRILVGYCALAVCAGSSSALRQLASGLYSCIALPRDSVSLPRSF